MKTNLIEQKIDRAASLMNRIATIPAEIDDIHERLLSECLNDREFSSLINLRCNLLMEKENKKRQLKEMLRVFEII